MSTSYMKGDFFEEKILVAILTNQQTMGVKSKWIKRKKAGCLAKDSGAIGGPN